jgi:hypothetical protein
MRRWLLGIFAAIPPVLAVVACGTDAVGVEACRQIEEARCKMAPNCGVDLTKPVHRDSPRTDIDACIRFYRDQCLHGLTTPSDPGQVAVTQCVDAINQGDCNVLLHPEVHPSCAWLIPPAPPATVVDAASEAVDVVVEAAESSTTQ